MSLSVAHRNPMIVGVAAIAMLSGCGVGSSQQPTPANGATRSVTLRDAHVAFRITVPQSVEVDKLRPGTERSRAACRSVVASLGPGQDRFVQLKAFSTGCQGRQTPLVNGRHGTYVSFHDVANPASVDHFDTKLGPATSFEQTYTACTNSCKKFSEPVVLIEIRAPETPEYPTLMLISENGVLSEPELRDYAKTVRPAP